MNPAAGGVKSRRIGRPVFVIIEHAGAVDDRQIVGTAQFNETRHPRVAVRFGEIGIVERLHRQPGKMDAVPGLALRLHETVLIARQPFRRTPDGSLDQRQQVRIGTENIAGLAVIVYPGDGVVADHDRVVGVQFPDQPVNLPGQAQVPAPPLRFVRQVIVEQRGVVPDLPDRGGDELPRIVPEHGAPLDVTPEILAVQQHDTSHHAMLPGTVQKLAALLRIGRQNCGPAGFGDRFDRRSAPPDDRKHRPAVYIQSGRRHDHLRARRRRQQGNRFNGFRRGLPVILQDSRQFIDAGRHLRRKRQRKPVFPLRSRDVERRRHPFAGAQFQNQLRRLQLVRRQPDPDFPANRFQILPGIETVAVKRLPQRHVQQGEIKLKRYGVQAADRRTVRQAEGEQVLPRLREPVRQVHLLPPAGIIEFHGFTENIAGTVLRRQRPLQFQFSGGARNHFHGKRDPPPPLDLPGVGLPDLPETVSVSGDFRRQRERGEFPGDVHTAAQAGRFRFFSAAAVPHHVEGTVAGQRRTVEDPVRNRDFHGPAPRRRVDSRGAEVVVIVPGNRHEAALVAENLPVISFRVYHKLIILGAAPLGFEHQLDGVVTINVARTVPDGGGAERGDIRLRALDAEIEIMGVAFDLYRRRHRRRRRALRRDLEPVIDAGVAPKFLVKPAVQANGQFFIQRPAVFQDFGGGRGPPVDSEVVQRAGERIGELAGIVADHQVTRRGNDRHGRFADRRPAAVDIHGNGPRAIADIGDMVPAVRGNRMRVGIVFHLPERAAVARAQRDETVKIENPPAGPPLPAHIEDFGAFVIRRGSGRLHPEFNGERRVQPGGEIILADFIDADVAVAAAEQQRVADPPTGILHIAVFDRVAGLRPRRFPEAVAGKLKDRLPRLRRGFRRRAGVGGKQLQGRQHERGQTRNIHTVH